MIRVLILIGLLLAPVTYAQESEDQFDIYKQIREDIERELDTKTADLAIQRFALGIYYDKPLKTSDDEGEEATFEMEKEEYMDFSLRGQMIEMCGTQDKRSNLYITCLQAQKILKQVLQRNVWLQSLGRDLQAIASGYEAGIEGYPGKVVDVIAKFAGIAHIWRASNDPFMSPMLEVLTKAKPWPANQESEIESKAAGIAAALVNLETEKEAEGEEEEDKEEDGTKKDRTKLHAAIWRYRHGVRYVRKEEGEDCEAANTKLDDYFRCLQDDESDEATCNEEFGGKLPDPSMFMMQRRWCDIEDQLIELSDILVADKSRVESSNERDTIYPSYVNQKENVYIWMRQDDVGLQPFIPIEPMQATLFTTDYEDCMEDGDISKCYEEFSQHLVRGGKYPSKIGDEERKQQPSIMGGGPLPERSEGERTGNIRQNNMVVKEPESGKGICSHPFGRRGYLCRNIEYEACDITQAQQDQLADAGTGGIVLTRCQPERFYDDVARKVSGSNICGIGGWREFVPNNFVVDTPEEQPDMVVPACSKCWVDVTCRDECIPGDNNVAFTAFNKHKGIVDICVPNNANGPGGSYYLFVHELIHAQQVCNESNLDTLDRTGLTVEKGKQSAAACCASEREAYFVQCKLMALDGALDKAGVTIDQCASAYANFSCQAHDANPDDEEYVCSNDGIDPAAVAGAINAALKELADQINLPKTCAESFNHPTIRALYNSFPPSCSPGCQMQYQNTVGNNLCYTGQCIEETHEFARDVPGRMALTEMDQGFPWDACVKPDPQLGDFEVAPALTGPKFPLYRPGLLLQQLDEELCQINGLPAKTPPVICGFDPTERLGLPPFSLMQSATDLVLQPAQYDATGLSIQFAAPAIASRITTDMLVQYLQPASRHFADLLNTMFDVFKGVGELEFPATMCPRYTEEDFTCRDLE